MFKFDRRSEQYRDKHLIYDTKTGEATAKGWCILFARIKGKNVFNSYYYNPEFKRLQDDLRTLLFSLDIVIDIEVSVPGGLDKLISGVKYYEEKIKKLYKIVHRPRTRYHKNKERIEEINDYIQKINQINLLLTAREEKSV